MLSFVAPDGTIRWQAFLLVLPRTEMIALPAHLQVKLSGNLPPHLPIGRIEKVRTPKDGILLVSESGAHLQITSENSLLFDMIWAQLGGLAHPTWSEILQSVRLPRRVQIAEGAAHDILRSHGEISRQLQELHAVLGECLKY